MGTLSFPWGWVRWSVPLSPVLEDVSGQMGPALCYRPEIQEAEAEPGWAQQLGRREAASPLQDHRGQARGGARAGQMEEGREEGDTEGLGRRGLERGTGETEREEESWRGKTDGGRKGGRGEGESSVDRRRN